MIRRERWLLRANKRQSPASAGAHASPLTSRVYRQRRALCARSKSTIIYRFHVLQNRGTVNNFSSHFLVPFRSAAHQHVFVHLLTHFADLKRSLTHKLFIRTSASRAKRAERGRKKRCTGNCFHLNSNVPSLKREMPFDHYSLMDFC